MSEDKKTLMDTPMENAGETLNKHSWAGQRILAILIPKEKGTITMLRGGSHKFKCTPNSEEKWYYHVLATYLQEGTNWEHYVATTMEHITRKCSGNLLPLDVTETKPEGLPDILWRFWIRQRIMFADKNIR